MNSTDTQAEHERFYDVLETGPRTGWPPRRLLTVVGTVAAAGLVVAGAVTLSDSEDSTSPPVARTPTSGIVTQQEREAELLADRVVAAYANHDAPAVTSSLMSGAQSWSALRRKTERDRAWSVEYLLKPCETRSTFTNGVMVECVSDMHLLHSEEVGVGPFEGSGVFTLMVREGAVANGDVSYTVKTGMGDHIDDVFTWVEENHPEEAEFLLGDEVEVPAGEWNRWTLLWQQYAAEYAAETTREAPARP